MTTAAVTTVLDLLGGAPALQERPLDQDEAERLARVLRALADPARLRLLSLIARAPEGGICVCDITEPLGLSQPTVSHHLKVLYEAGLIDRERRGTWVYYWPIPGQLDVIARLLTSL
jgi:ArsR family transcriptional regulator